MKKLFSVALGILTAIGGFVDIGDLVTNAQVGARFGWSLGLAFQVNDDLLGIWGHERATGKEPTDLARHKKTLPVLYALQRGSPEDRRRLAELIVTSDPDAGDVDEIVAILDRSGARDFTRAEARRYRDEALAELDLR